MRVTYDPSLLIWLICLRMATCGLSLISGSVSSTGLCCWGSAVDQWQSRARARAAPTCVDYIEPNKSKRNIEQWIESDIFQIKDFFSVIVVVVRFFVCCSHTRWLNRAWCRTGWQVAQYCRSIEWCRVLTPNRMLTGIIFRATRGLWKSNRRQL